MAEKTTAFTGPVVVGLNDKKGEIRLTDGKNVNEAKYLSIAAPDNITSDTTLTFPNGAGTAGQILSTDGNGGLSWVNDSAGNPAGTNGQVQTNDGGTFGAISEGTAGQVLKSNGAGVAPSFQTDASGIAAVVDDTSPELGGDLASNGNNINFADDNEARFGNGTDLRIFHDTLSNNSFIRESGAGSLVMNTNNLVVQNAAGTANLINAPEGAAGLDLYYNGNIKLSTSNTGIQTTGTVNVNGAYSLPTSDGTANQVMTTDGAGNVTFQNAAAADPITSSLDVNNPKTIKLNGDFPTGTQQVALGNGALDSNTGGSYNTAIGSSALTGSTSGSFNVAVGQNAADANNGDRNVAVGSNALGASGSNSDNVAIGLRAMFSNGSGSENVAIGTKTMDQGNGGTQNVAIGYKALENGGNQQQNIAIGWQALKDCSGGFQNTVIGDDAMNLSVNAWGCVAIGDGALQQVEGVVNIGIGQSVGGSLTSGASNVLIGRNAATSLTTGDNNIIIGTNAQNSSATVSNEITLGDSSISTLRCNTTSITSLSDARDKKDVEDANIGLDFINDLRPVKFVWDTRDGAKKDIKEVGFIAQELDEVQQKHGVEDHLQLVLKNNPDKLEASQGKLIPILVQAIKDLKKEIDELKKA